MEKKSEFKIPGFIETGEVNATPLTDGTELDLQMARKDLKPYEAIRHEAMNFAVETPKEEVGLFEQEPTTELEEAKLIGEKTVRFRKDKAAGIEPESLAVSSLRRQEELDRGQFGLAA